MVDHHIDLVGGFQDFSTAARPAVDEDICVMLVRVAVLPAFVAYDMVDVDTDIAVIVDFCECDEWIHLVSYLRLFLLYWLMTSMTI